MIPALCPPGLAGREVPLILTGVSGLPVSVVEAIVPVRCEDDGAVMLRVDDSLTSRLKIARGTERLQFSAEGFLKGMKRGVDKERICRSGLTDKLYV